MERKVVKSKHPFWSQPKALDGSKFVPTCHYCGVIGHIRLQCYKLKREQNHVTISLPKKPSRPKHIVCHYCVPLVILDLITLSFMLLKESKEKRNLSFFEVVLKRVNRF